MIALSVSGSVTLSVTLETTSDAVRRELADSSTLHSGRPGLHRDHKMWTGLNEYNDDQYRQLQDQA